MTRQQPTLFFSKFARGTTMLALLLCAGVSAHAQDNDNILATLIFESGPLQSAAETLPTTPAVSTSADDAAPAPAATTDSIMEYQAAIGRALEEEGLYSQLLSEQYEALGVAFYREGRLEEATEAFEDAMHIQKVNKGLFNLDQTRLVEYLIQTHTARGDFENVDNHRHYLYYLQDKNLDESDPRLAAAKLAWADWNIEAYVKGYRDSFYNPVSLMDSVDASRGVNSVQFNVPVRRPNIDNSSVSSPGVADTDTSTSSMPVIINVPQLNSNAVITNAAVMDYNMRSIPYAMTNDMVFNQRLYEAENLYEELLEQMEKNGAPLGEQQMLQEKLGNVNYLLKKELEGYEQIRDRGSIAFNRVNQEYTNDAEMIASRRYVTVKNAMTELAEKIADDPDLPVADKARAYITLGDLHLSFDRPQRAREAYDTAYAILTAGGYSDSAAASLLTPAPDLAVPGFGIHSFSRAFFGIAPDVAIPYKGHVDMAFDKDRLGQVSDIRILDSSPETPQQVRTALVDYLRNQRFRPAFAQGDSIDHDDIQLRYYYYY